MFRCAVTRRCAVQRPSWLEALSALQAARPQDRRLKEAAPALRGAIVRQDWRAATKLRWIVSHSPDPIHIRQDELERTVVTLLAYDRFSDAFYTYTEMREKGMRSPRAVRKLMEYDESKNNGALRTVLAPLLEAPPRGQRKKGEGQWSSSA